MPNLTELLAQRAELEKQIEDLQTTARSDAIAQIKTLMADHGLTLQDITARPAGKKSSQSKGKSVPAKYRNGDTGETWSGRGLKPKWLKAQLDAGKNLDDFAV